MKKIAIISGSYLLNIWNGLGRATNALAWGLSTAGFDVTVFVPSSNGKTFSTQQGQVLLVHVAMLEKKRISSVPMNQLEHWNSSVAKLLANKHFDTLITMTSCNYPSVIKYREVHPKTRLISLYPYLYKNAHWIEDKKIKEDVCKFELESFEKSDILVAHTELVGTTVATASNRQVDIIPNAIPLPEEILLELPVVENMNICYVGRLNKTKSIETLFRAVAMLSSDVTLSVSSPENSDTYADKLKELAKSLGISGRVNITGWINSDKVKKVYCASALTIVSGVSEPYGFGILDSLLMGTRVIASEFSGLTRYLINQDNTYTNVDSLAQQISAKLRDDASTIAQERMDGIQYVLNYHSPSYIASQVAEVL